ncbi:unnamed protein product [Paramecium pentaurelia]|uniref:Uncharacterized protein n=1 Tax=Paramecium pentaurelia TaxID=43138 RepID=A0A8S1VMK5_9CILI|nr:unnamed protein product [Paramecium pentaurelia]
MNLRKFSQQTYFKAKCLHPQKQKQKGVNSKHIKPIYEYEKKDLKEQFEQNQSNQQTYINQDTNELTVSDFETSTNMDKKLISNPRTQRKHFSPIFRTNNITIDPNSTKFQLSLSREKQMSNDVISLWDSNQRGNKQSYNSFQFEEKQTLISKGSQKKLEKGIKIQQELDEFLKFRHQNIQASFDCTKLKKLEKRKQHSKINLEYQIDQSIDKQNNEKECQFNYMTDLNQEIYTKLNNSSELQQKSKSQNSTSIKSNPLIPIHIRYQYEKEYKEAKQKQNSQKLNEQQYQQKKKVSKDQIEEFFKEQQRFMKKRAEFFEKEFEKKLWEASQNENEFLYQPVLNEQSSKILDSKLKGKNFDQRIEQFQQNRQIKIEQQIQNMKPSFTPTISKKSRKLMENPKQRLTLKNEKSFQQQNWRAKTQEGQ